VTPLAEAVAQLRGVEPGQPHCGFIAEQQLGQGVHCLNAKQGFHPIQHDILEKVDHLALDPVPLQGLPPGDHADLVQEMDKGIQDGALFQAVLTFRTPFSWG
jgi:hypothetical protein